MLSLPCIRIPLQKNSTSPRVAANPSYSLLIITVSVDWQIGMGAYEEPGIWHNLPLSHKVAHPYSVAELAYYI